jgi:hypothetical protein
MSDGITARSFWRERKGLGMMGRQTPTSINEIQHYNPKGPKPEELQKILMTDKNTTQEVLDTIDKWKDLDRQVAMDKIIKLEGSIEVIRDASTKLLGEDPSTLKIEKIGDENFKKINTLLVEETVRIEDAAIAELQTKINEAL